MLRAREAEAALSWPHYTAEERATLQLIRERTGHVRDIDGKARAGGTVNHGTGGREAVEGRAPGLLARASPLWSSRRRSSPAFGFEGEAKLPPLHWL